MAAGNLVGHQRLCRLSVQSEKHIVTDYFHLSCHSEAQGRCVPTPATQIVTAALLLQTAIGRAV